MALITTEEFGDRLAEITKDQIEGTITEAEAAVQYGAVFLDLVGMEISDPALARRIAFMVAQWQDAAGLLFKGELESTADLPTEGNRLGDMWLINGYVWLWSFDPDEAQTDTPTLIWVDIGRFQGPVGPAGVISSITVQTIDEGEDAYVELEGTASNRVINLFIPRGATGNTGLTPVITFGDVSSLPPGSDPEIEVTGTPEYPVFSFKLPQGAKGDTGLTPNISVEFALVAHGDPATVTRSGSNENPLLTFSIPAPLDGDDGREVEFNRSDTHVQIRYEGETEWTDLIPLADLMGAKGDKGDGFAIGATGNSLAARDQYDDEEDGFSFIDASTGMIYFRQGVTPGVWSDGIPFGAAQSAILDALAALSASEGVLVQTGAASFAKRSIGVAQGSSIPDRDAADTRYRRVGQAVPLEDITGLVTALGDKADAAAVLAALGSKADAQAVADALGLKADKTYVDDQLGQKISTSQKGAANGVAPLGADQKVPAIYLPSAGEVLAFATVAEVWAGTVANKVISPAIAIAAKVPQTPDYAVVGNNATITIDLNQGRNFGIAITANFNNFANPANVTGKAGESGIITVANGAFSRGFTFGSVWVPAASTSPDQLYDAIWQIIYQVLGNGKIRYVISKGYAS